MDKEDSYFDMLNDSVSPHSPQKDVAHRKPPPLMGYETFKKAIKPEILDKEEKVLEEEIHIEPQMVAKEPSKG